MESFGRIYLKEYPEAFMDGSSQSNENLKAAISLTMQELSPLIKASENRMPVENLMTYANDIGKCFTTLR